MMAERAREAEPAKIPPDHRRYGTFQPPPLPPPTAALPRPPPLVLHYPHALPQQPLGYHAVPVGCQSPPYTAPALVDGIPISKPPLPFCGVGVGWALFVSGFFLAAIPWYVGAFILVFVAQDRREKPGLVACTVGAILAVMSIVFNFFRFW